MKNTLKTLTGLAAVASISAMASFGAHAQSNQIEAKDSGFYVGGNYGYLRVEGEDDFDDDKDVGKALLDINLMSGLQLKVVTSILVITVTTLQALKQTATQRRSRVFFH